jgi:hypothetical protein
VQDVRRAAVELAPCVQSALLSRTQALAHQPLGDSHGPTPVVAARPLDFRAQRLGCLTDAAQGRLRITEAAPASALPRCRFLFRGLVGIYGLQQDAGRALQAGGRAPVSLGTGQAQQRVHRAPYARFGDLRLPFVARVLQHPVRVPQ